MEETISLSDKVRDLIWSLLFAPILRANACDAARDVDDRGSERDREIIPETVGWGG